MKQNLSLNSADGKIVREGHATVFAGHVILLYMSPEAIVQFRTQFPDCTLRPICRIVGDSEEDCKKEWARQLALAAEQCASLTIEERDLKALEFFQSPRLQITEVKVEPPP